MNRALRYGIVAVGSLLAWTTPTLGQGWGRVPTVEFEYGRSRGGGGERELCECRDRGPGGYGGYRESGGYSRNGGDGGRRDWYVAARFQPRFASEGYLPDNRSSNGSYDPRGGFDDYDMYRPAALPLPAQYPSAEYRQVGYNYPAERPCDVMPASYYRPGVPLDVAPFVSRSPQETDGLYLGKGLFGQPRAFAKDEPVRNLFRFILP